MFDVLWFMLGLFVGGFLGMMTMALMVVAAKADRNLEKEGQVDGEGTVRLLREEDQGEG